MEISTKWPKHIISITVEYNRTETKINLNKIKYSLASCLFTTLEHVSCQMTHCKESHWMKKKSVPKRSATAQKKVGLNFFFNRFYPFCSAHVNKWTVYVSKIFLESNRNRSQPYRTVNKNRSGYSPLVFHCIVRKYLKQNTYERRRRADNSHRTWKY